MTKLEKEIIRSMCDNQDDWEIYNSRFKYKDKFILENSIIFDSLYVNGYGWIKSSFFGKRKIIKAMEKLKNYKILQLMGVGK